MVRKFRTAVLVVHGIGSQRPLETVRGVVDAVWFDNDDHSKGTKKLWSHPEPSGVDLDLTVMTTNGIQGAAGSRVADFHELYWAHQMSETKAVAVLLWLFELGRRGPNLKAGMNGLWWCGVVYLCLLLLAVTHLSLEAATWFASITERPYVVLITFYLMTAVAVVIGCAAAFGSTYSRLGKWLLITTCVFAAIALLTHYAVEAIHAYNIAAKPIAVIATNIALTPLIALVATALIMRKPGVIAFCLTYFLSWVFFGLFLLFISLGILPHEGLREILAAGRMPWSLGSHSSAVAALLIIGVYLIVNAWFLQPYLGDAARYFRNSPANVAVRRAIRKDAVDTLDQLHRSRDYDRIVVVAHSLGTVVAYDMLRAYYSRICRQIPIDKLVNLPAFQAVDGGTLSGDAMRAHGRVLITELARASQILADAARPDGYRPAKSEEVDAWLVTDFVTVGSALTHARYFMATGKDQAELDRDFANHVREREFPTCPPQMLFGDGRIAFTDPTSKSKRLHHGGMFGMTRWTNLYFEMSEIFWGDAIGGRLQDDFGGGIEDKAITTQQPPVAEVFNHTKYWDVTYPAGRAAPHIKALREAINLEDKP